MNACPHCGRDLDAPAQVGTIDDLDLSVRPWNCLRAARIDTIEELTTRTPAELMKLRSFGIVSLNEVRWALWRRGLSLSCDNDGDYD